MFKHRYLVSLLLFFSMSKAFCENPGCEIVAYNTRCELRNNKLVKFDSVVIQVNNRSGERFTTVTIPYSKNTNISGLKAWMEDAYGNVIRKLKNSEITERSSIADYSLYEDDFVKIFTLKHNEYPYRIVYYYETTFKQYISIGWNPIIHYKVPTKEAKFSLLLPKGLSFQRYSTMISEPSMEESASEKKYTWHAQYSIPIENEIFAPCIDEILPNLTIVPSNFTFGVEGSSKDWASFGSWMHRLMQGLDDLPEQEKSTVRQLIKGITDKHEIVKVLYHYMQDHTRYINVSINIGGLKPYPASYVSTNKYGDCKALTNYMKALLKLAGIQAYYTIVYGGGQPPKIVEQIPGSHYFNHVILTVPLEKDTLWLENTSNIDPVGYTGTFTQNRKALLVDEKNSKLINIPALKNKDVLVSRKISVEFNRMGDANVTIKSLVKGEEFEMFNGLNTLVNDDKKDEIIRKWLPYSNFDLIRWTLNRKERDSREIQLELNMTFYKYLKSIGKESYFGLIPIELPTFEEPKDRKLPLEVPYPIYKIDTLLYHTPADYIVKNIPKEIRLASDIGSYTVSFHILDEVIQVVRVFELYARAYSKDQYPEFYKSIRAIKEAEKNKVVLVEK